MGMHRPLTAASLVTRRTSRLVTTTPSRSLFTRTQSAQQPQRAYKMSAIPQLLANNEQFSTTFKQQYPELLAQLGKTQKPKVCWLGCADSRVPPELATGVQPGDIFVHRNIGNVFHDDDPAALSVLTFAINALGVEAIMVVGHTGCGAVNAGMSFCHKELKEGQSAAPSPDDKHTTILRKWTEPIAKLAENMLKANNGEPLNSQQLDELTAQHVRETVRAVARSWPLQNAWKSGTKSKEDVVVVGWLFDVREMKAKD